MAKKKHVSLASVFAQNETAFLLQKRPLLHIDCQGYVIVENCKSIILYTKETILLDMGECLVTITGNDIHMRNFQPQLFSLHGENLRIECQNKGDH